jgi:MarR family transcriptional regulator, 2-MHQ and catechol-resistance regulon repressor
LTCQINVRYSEGMIEQRRIDDPRITFFGHLFEAHAKLTHRLNAELEAAVGIPLSWYGVLLLIGRTSEGVRPIGELISATAFTSGGVTRLVDRMERAGYVQRSPCPADRRVQYVGLTEAGRDLLERATEVHLRGIQQHMIDQLEPDEVTVMDRLLAKLVQGPN